MQNSVVVFEIQITALECSGGEVNIFTRWAPGVVTVVASQGWWSMVILRNAGLDDCCLTWLPLPSIASSKPRVQ